MKRITKPWGYEVIVSKTDTHVIKEIHVLPTSRLSLQYHDKKIETMILVEGEAYLDIIKDNEKDTWSSQSMERLFPYLIPPGTIHRVSTTNSSCVIIEVSSTELDDVVRLEDDYGRTNG